MGSSEQVQNNENEPRDRLSADRLDEIGNPLAVVRGYIQLLQRRLHRGQVIDEGELLRVLGVMDEASLSVIEKLAEIAGRGSSSTDASTVSADRQDEGPVDD